jgi:hypothetical protein
MMALLIDLSHPVVEGMETYRPLPTPRVEVLNDYDASRYEGKSEFLIASLHLCGNTGTYVDSPRHRFRDGSISPAYHSLTLQTCQWSLPTSPPPGERLALTPYQRGTYTARRSLSARISRVTGDPTRTSPPTPS